MAKQFIMSPLINHFLASDYCKDYTSVQGQQSTLIELPINGAGFQQSIYMGSSTFLDGQNCTITGIEVISATQMPVSPTNKEVIAQNSLSLGILHISNLNRENIASLPLASLSRINNNGKLKFTKFDSQVWQNCYVEFFDNIDAAPELVLLLNVYYISK